MVGKLKFTGVVPNLKILILSYRSRQLDLNLKKISPRKQLFLEISTFKNHLF